MTADIDINSKVEVNANKESGKPHCTTSDARSSIVSPEDNKSNDNNVVAMTSIAPSMVPSTDTASSSIATKIEGEPNEKEILLLGLEYSSDLDGPKDCDNETCSLSSSTSSVVSRYFEPTDFLPWEELYSKAEYAPHVGFAMVAGGFACLHPFVFFAGVVTAVGAARAAGATYEYATSTKQRPTQTRGFEEDDSSANDLHIPCDCFPTAIQFNDAKREISTTHLKQGDEDSFPILAKRCSSCSTIASTVGDSSEEAHMKAEIADDYTTSIPSTIKSPSKVQQTTGKNFNPICWVTDNFRVLPNIALENIEFRGLNANEFFDVFFADDAPFGFPAFHKLRRDKEVQYSSWNDGVTSDKLHSNSIEFPPSIVAKERAVQYDAKNNSFLGPAYAPTKKIQRAYFVSKKMLVIEIMVTLSDIPFSKQFYLIERWIIDGTRTALETYTNSNRNSRKKNTKQQSGNISTKVSSSHCVYLTISSEVYFTRECPFESTVRKESTKQICEISKCWNAMAQAGLKRTEETRTKRLRQKEKERILQESPASSLDANSSTYNKNMCESTESIEIEHVDDNLFEGNTNIRSDGDRRRTNTRNKLRLYSKNRKQQPVPIHHRFQNRSQSRPLVKLLARGAKSCNIRENGRKPIKAPPKVRIISSVGAPSD